MPANVDDVAAAVLARTGRVTTMQLQKLLYYCQAWHLARFDEPLFASEIQAWRDGPVVRRIFTQHQHLFHIDAWPGGNVHDLGAKARGVVAWVTDRYGDLTSDELSDLTHIETPWLLARHGELPEATTRWPISHDDMRNYYARQQMTPNAAAHDAIASAELEGHNVDDNLREIVEEVARGGRTADAVIADILTARARE